MLKATGRAQSFLRKLVIGRPFSSLEQKYTKLSHVEHILARPGMYVGSNKLASSDIWLHDKKLNMMSKQTMNITPALLKIFDEIIVNAADNQQRDKTMTKIEVDVKYVKKSKTLSISVKNDGLGIPIKMHEKEKVFIPELIFGQLMTGSNFDDTVKRVVGGTHGHGAKMTNIFSKKFSVEAYDKTRNKLYEQEWKDNMGSVDLPKVSDVSLPNSYTKVTFEPDLTHLGFDSKVLNDGITMQKTIELFRRRAMDIAASVSPAEVSFNGQVIAVQSFLDYVKLFKAEDTGDKKQSLEESVMDPIYHSKVNARWEVAVKRSPSKDFENMSFVNGVWTSRGGSHVKYVADQVVAALDEALRKELKAKGVTSTATSNNIRNKLMLFVSCRVENPEFDGQSKEVLMSKPEVFGSTCILKASFLKSIVQNSGIVEGLVEDVLAAENRKLNASSRSPSGKKMHNLEKLQDATKAGTNRSLECTLILTEGDSAKPLAVAGLEEVGRELFGVMPLKGKVLNVRVASKEQVRNNKEIMALCQALGLDFNKKYETLEGQGLRYGKVMIMTDQDTDGSHIKGLLINLFHLFWPNLLAKEGFLQQFITPIVKATSNKKASALLPANVSFYSLMEYNDWRAKLTPDELAKYKVKYYKGLGTSNASEGKEYFRALDKNRKTFYCGGKQDDLIDMAFNKSRAEDRKLWLNMVYDKDAFVDPHAPRVSYEEFVDKELIQFSAADNIRSIPSVVDGLKPSQRKVLFGCFKKNLREEMKVDALGGYIASNTAYHHGEASLQGTIIGMAQDFVGSNNVNFLVPSGNFGTRALNKDSSSPRYINTSLSEIARALFPAADDRLCPQQSEDGMDIEPLYFVPVIPTLLLNGSSGIGTGWSTSIPQYNILEIIKRVRARINEEKPTKRPLIPWTKGFTGTIVESPMSRNNTISPTATSYTATGIATRLSATQVEISELPPGRWTDDYKASVLVPMAELKEIQTIADHHKTDTVRFVIHGTKLQIDDLEKRTFVNAFKLEAPINITNMHAFNAAGEITRYDLPEKILDDHFEVRLNTYKLRKTRNEDNFRADEMTARSKSSFIADILKGDIVILAGGKAVREDLIVEDLRKRGFPTRSAIEAVRSPHIKVFEAEETEDDAGDSQPDDTSPSGGTGSGGKKSAHGYRYLLDLPIHSLTQERAAALNKQATEAAEKLRVSQAVTVKDLWLADLDALETKYLELTKKGAAKK